MYKTILAILAIASTAPLFGATTATTSLSGVINSGSLALTVSSNSIAFDAQQITSSGSAAQVAAGSLESYTVTIADTRGSSETVSVTADIAPLTYTGNIRPILVTTGSATGNYSASYSATLSAAATGVSFASATAGINQHGEFTVNITPQALNGTSAIAGTYTGSIVVSVN